MARKSRKTLLIEPITEVKPIRAEKPKIKVGGYIRLSSEYGDVDSVETQVLMIEQYIEDNDEFELYSTYIDVGYSGTNFDRPDFERMMNDVRCGKIQCIIVKDLSRFGRNYIETGYYLETIFPKLNIRLISITDRFDSDREDDMRGLQIPIKNMINSMYAMDASKKFVDSFELHSKLGDYKIRSTTYGYLLKDYRLVVDPNTASIVKIIFKWFLQGYPIREIARRLNNVEAIMPAVSKSLHENREITYKNTVWDKTAISRILQNPTYTGDTVHGRRRHRLCTNEVVRCVDKDEWVIHRDTHTALISHEAFDAAQDIIMERRNKWQDSVDRWEEARKKFTNSLNRRVKCADCGNTMLYARQSHAPNSGIYDQSYYFCYSEKRHYCNRRIDEDYLKTVVMDQIKQLIKSFCDRKELINNLRNGSCSKGKLLSVNKKIQHLNKKIVDLEETIETLYINLTSKVIDENDYRSFREHYVSEKEKLEEDMKLLKNEKYQIERKLENVAQLEAHFEQFIDEQVYNQQLVDELIDCILVSKDNSIEIHFKCDDVIAQLCELLEE